MSKFIVQCFSTGVVDAAAESDLPKRIMYAPGGTYPLGLFVPQPDGTKKRARVVVNVTAAAVANLQACRAEYRQIKPSYEPCADKNHERKEATFWAGDFAWDQNFQQVPGGEVKPGIVVECKTWTSLGKDSILGKTLRYFSPDFILDANPADAKVGADGVLFFPKGTRGSAENPAQIIGHAMESIGTLTNNQAFFQILPVWAEHAENPAAAAAPTQEVVTMKKYKVLKAYGGYAVGATVELADDAAASPLATGLIVQAESAAVFEALAESSETVKNENKKLRDQIATQEKAGRREKGRVAVQAAAARGAFPPAKKITVDGKEVTYADYLIAQCEENPAMVTVIEGMGAQGGATTLTTRTVPQDGRDLAVPGAVDVSGLLVQAEGQVGIEDATRGFLMAQAEASRAEKAGAQFAVVDDLRRQAGRIYTKFIAKPFRDIGHLPVQGARFADCFPGLNVQADNALGTLASVNIVAQECLQMLKPHIWPFIGADMSFDLSSKGAVYKQTVDTRRRNIPLVLDHGNDNDGAYQYSDATAIDAACTLSQWPYIQFKFGAGTVAATTRDLKREFMEPLMIGYGEALFKSWTGVMTVANFDKTAILNRQGYVLGATPNRSSLVGIDNDGDTLNWPKGARRIAIMATDAYNQMRNDPYLISYMYAGPESEARRTGDIGERENVMPYKSQFLNARADGVRGFAQIASATLVVGRVPVTPESAFGLAFPGLRNVITEPDSGASMLLTVWIAQDGSLVGIRGEGLLGANVGDPNAGELLF